MDDLQWIRDVEVIEVDINSDFVITGVTDIDKFNEKLVELYGQERIDYARSIGVVPNCYINTVDNDYIKHTLESGTTISIRVDGSNPILKTGWSSDDISPNYLQQTYGIKNVIEFYTFLISYKK